MKTLLVLFLMAILSGPAYADTLGGLASDFRERTAERGTPAAADSTVYAWLNMAQQSIASLTGLLEKEWATEFSGDYRLTPPADIRLVKRVKVWSEDRWYDMAAYADSGSLPYDLTWDSATPSLFLDDNGYIQTYTALTFDEDSLSYTLPIDFRTPLGLLYQTASTWYGMPQNPFFLADTGLCWFVGWRAPDTAEAYVKTGTLDLQGETLRLFYLRGLQSGDSIRVVYGGMPAEMTTASVECELLDNLEVFVIDEAVRYYEAELKHYDVAQALWQQLRHDLGFSVKK